jgi:hypothetical protein
VREAELRQELGLQTSLIARVSAKNGAKARGKVAQKRVTR